jgi:hypothetical protein
LLRRLAAAFNAEVRWVMSRQTCVSGVVGRL